MTRKFCHYSTSDSRRKIASKTKMSIYFRSRAFCFIVGRYLINAPPKSKTQFEIENQKNSIDDF